MSNQKMDHREVGRIMNLFHIQEEAVGSIFWHENGWFIYNQIKNYMQEIQRKYNYREVNSPQLIRRELWERSGHWDNYNENMFCIDSDENIPYALKPMNCACHIQIYNHQPDIISYKNLPIRYAEFGQCMRNEPSGSLSGLMRVRSFVQDDAHIFCMEGQIKEEVELFFQMAKEVYSKFGFEDIKILLSGRPEKSAGSDDQWDKAEQALKDICNENNIPYKYIPGAGAFYGPKLEFMINDRNNKEWQCGTIQVDFILPQRLNAKYADQHGCLQHPVILHRAILGSFERFIGILLENFGFTLPSWLNPNLLAIIDISKHGFNMDLPLYKEQYIIDKDKKDLRQLIKKYSEQKYQYILVYGKKEEESSELPLNILGKDIIKINKNELISFIK